MGSENLNPLDEIKQLEQQIEHIDELAGLKPIFFRLDELQKEFSSDFEVQLAVGDAKQHLVSRGTKIKKARETQPAAPATIPLPPKAQPEPPAPAGMASAPPPLPPRAQTAPPPLPKQPQATPAPPPQATPTQPQAPSLASQPTVPETLILPPAPKASPVPKAAPPPIPAMPKPAAPAPVAPAPKAPLPADDPFATVQSQALKTPAPTIQHEIPTASTVRTAPPQGSASIPPDGPPAMPAGPPPGPPAQPPLHWKRALVIGALSGMILALAGIAIVVNIARKRNIAKEGPAGEVVMEIATNPPGASVRLNGDTACTSNCKLSLPPGNYQVTAFLDGYEPAASTVTLANGKAATVNLTLEPQGQTLRIVTDLDSGKVTLDDRPPADLQEGGFIADHLAPGPHTVRFTGKTGDASFAFETAGAQPPNISRPVTAHNLRAVLVASLGGQARLATNSGPMKLVVNGQPESDAGTEPIDLKSFAPGLNNLVLGDAKDQRSFSETFGPAPMLTVFLKSDLNIGTLIVSTGEDDVRVFLNDKEYRRKTAKGQLRIQTIGQQTVRVAKDGFDPVAPQSAEVKKGQETRLEFKLTKTPQVATLQIAGATPGAEVLIDGRSAGTVAPDGTFSNSSVNPGDHQIDLRRNGFTPRSYQRSFRAGGMVVLAGNEATLAAVPVAPPPPPPKPVIELKKEAPPPPKPGTMADFADPAQWHEENGVQIHRGAGFLAYNLTPHGVFTFTVELVKGGGLFRGGKIRWALNRVDDKNYALYELDSKNFTARVVQNGKTLERTKTPLKDLEKQKQFTIQIDVSPEHIVHKMYSGGELMTLDSWAEPGRNFSQGKFGFIVQGNDEIGLQDFKFQPK